MDSFLELNERVRCYDAMDLYGDVLAPSIPDAQLIMRRLARFRRLTLALPGSISLAERWEWFELQRLREAMLQPLRVSLQQYVEFFRALWFVPFHARASGEPRPAPFDPAYFEIVSLLTLGSDDRGIQATGTLWPGLRFGEMIFAKAGVGVACHTAYGLREEEAETSLLYFAQERPARTTSSRIVTWEFSDEKGVHWYRTFARDYRVGDYLFLNVDGSIDLATLADGAAELVGTPIDVAADILLFHSIVRHADRPEVAPYDWRLALARSSDLWYLNAHSRVPFREALARVHVV